MSRALGPPVDSPTAQPPTASTLTGRTVRLERLTPAHAAPLFALVGNTADPTQVAVWDYMPEGPFANYAAFEQMIISHAKSTDPYFFAIIGPGSTGPDGDEVLGYISLMSIVPAQLRLEIGHVVFSPRLQRSTAATEIVFLLLKYSFESGYRRVEWKCNSLNEGSKRAAGRFGFVYEGTFRQHMVVKGRNRDTAWFSMVREEWEGGVRAGFEGWLGEGNFDELGRQKGRLERFIKRGYI
ncbi:acyl-CoA N-acyltransferase [Aspergillus steynii IBT 23096]|uniref:Acyl-CoA N-acyltransferase n=1 Tax=Aspergillus steynii IBT 23096 TaxID=1392250 RepID=A0A2I2GKB1_9EURO|nr:acyl-CoA N-acyltransferase [Aspergillus steynii IBT 23096]PLB53323.1 acyl-CoA N-acyltransferase [Aspergillus steynii IBT 23096]